MSHGRDDSGGSGSGGSDGLEAWLAAAVVGEIEEEERVQLNQRLRCDPAARSRWIAYTTLHGLLRWEAPAAAAVPPQAGATPFRRPLERRPRHGAWRSLAAAALLLGAILGAILGGWTALERWRHPALAVLVASEDAQWEQGATPYPGGGIPARTLRLYAGVAELRFAGGARAILQGPAELALRSRTAATLLQGRLVVRAEGEARGFTVDAAGMEVVDRGTEFAIQAVAGVSAEVQVFDGAVDLVAPGDGVCEPLRLSAEEAVRIDGERHAIERTAFRPDAFVRILKRDLASGDLEQGLVGWWPLDATAGDIAEDGSGHGRHGRLINMGFSTGSIAGRIGRALQFNGHNAMIRVPYDPGFDLATLTLAAWIRPARQLPPTTDAVIAMQRGAWGMGVLVNDHAKSVFWDDDRLARFRFAEDTWYHLAVTYDGALRRMYVDARVVGTWPSAPPRHAHDPFTIGGMGSGNDREPWFFNGAIDDVRLYGRALTSGEVRTLYLRGCSGR